MHVAMWRSCGAVFECRFRKHLTLKTDIFKRTFYTLLFGLNVALVHAGRVWILGAAGDRPRAYKDHTGVHGAGRVVAAGDIRGDLVHHRPGRGR